MVNVHNVTSMFHLIKDTATVGVLFATGAVIDERTMVPIGTLFTVCGLVWWLSRKLQRVDDRLEHIEKSIQLPVEERSNQRTRKPWQYK